MMRQPAAPSPCRPDPRRGGASAMVLAVLVAFFASGCSFSWDSEGISDVLFGGRPASEITGAGEVVEEVEEVVEDDGDEHEGSTLRRIAVLPTAYTDGTSGQPCDLCPDSVVMKPTDAKSARLVTGFVYEAIARHPRFLFPRADAVEKAVAARPDRRMAAAAQQLAAAGQADVVVVFALLELRPRVGPDSNPEVPAGASVYASLVDARSGEVLWSDFFNRDEKARNRVVRTYDKIANDAPIRWKTAQEFSEVGVDKLVDDLVDELD